MYHNTYITHSDVTVCSVSIKYYTTLHLLLPYFICIQFRFYKNCHWFNHYIVTERI